MSINSCALRSVVVVIDNYYDVQKQGVSAKIRTLCRFFVWEIIHVVLNFIHHPLLDKELRP